MPSRSAEIGKASVRMVETKAGYSGVVFYQNQKIAELSDSDANSLWQQLLDVAAKTNPKFVGFPGAIKRFHEVFRDGFSSNVYQAKERAYKLAAKQALEQHAPLEAVLNGGIPGKSFLTAFRKTALLQPTFENARIQELLQSPEADAFTGGAAQFTAGDISGGLARMTPALRKHNVAKWTAVTYLPYLWRPEAHMFLKPEVTREFAESVGHDFAKVYDSSLDKKVYDSLLDLTQKTEIAISSMQPQDRIDVQSFIWVVGRYDEADAAKVRAQEDE